jgi:hypothetical protein
MKDYFPDTQAKTLKEDSLGLFTRFSFLPVHFDWTNTDDKNDGREKMDSR